MRVGEPNRLLTGGIFRLRYVDGEYHLVMPSDAGRYGLFWIRTMYPDGTVCFRPVFWPGPAL